MSLIALSKTCKRILVAVFCACSPCTAYAQDLGARPIFDDLNDQSVKLGQLLFYDPILSGNRNISCATCHHPKLGTADGVSLSFGEGAIGLGRDRVAEAENRPEQRIPRNAPALWNLGASEFTSLFHDGRLEFDATQPDGIRTPLGQDMTAGFEGILSAQSMFPVLSGDEMAGHYSENEISTAVRLSQLSTSGGAWDRITKRVMDIPEYQEMFAELYPNKDHIAFTDIANVIADFIRFEWRADASPFDQALQGGAPLPEQAAKGMELFYGKAGCADCHSGWLQTDHQFHSIAMPQFGPGKAARFERHARDIGRMRVTGAPEDAYKFRTPSLRNVALSAPYGHNGAYDTLESIIRHHLDPVKSLYSYNRNQAILPNFPEAEDWRILDDTTEVTAIAESNSLEPKTLKQDEIDQLVAFLNALTDEKAAEGRLGVPKNVPSGLPVDH